MKGKSAPTKNRPSSFLLLLSWILLCEGAGFLGSLATFSQIPTWYAGLVKPSFSPPNWLFGPVWTLLYLFMGIAAYRVMMKGMQRKDVKQLIWLFLGHLGINVLWSLVFFGLHSIGGGILVISVLWTLIAMLTFRFSMIDRFSSYLMVPYLLWVSFASLLNVSLFFLNL